MDKSNILEQIKKYLQMKKEESLKEKRMVLFETALKELNIEKINEYLNEGFSISDYEQRNSSLRKVIDAYESDIIFLLEDYRRQNTHMKDGEFLRQFQKWSIEEIPEEIKAKIIPMEKAVLNLMNTLYEHGADINHHTYLSYSSSSIFDEKWEIASCASVFNIAIACWALSKQFSIIDWFLEKEELVLESRMIPLVVNEDNPESVLLLEKLLNRGFRDKNTDFHGLELNAMVYCIAHKEISGRQEKFDLLWKYANEEEKQKIISNWDISSIHIPSEYEDEGTSFRV